MAAPLHAPAPDGLVEALFLSGLRGTPMRPADAVEADAGRGFRGCRHAARRPGGKRQVLLVDAAELRGLGLGPGQLKENVVLSGVALEALPAGQRLRLGADVVLELTEPCVPCWKLDALRPGLLTEAWGRRGQLARVLTDGVVRVGDTVTLLDVNPDAPRPIRPRLP